MDRREIKFKINIKKLTLILIFICLFKIIEFLSYLYFVIKSLGEYIRKMCAILKINSVIVLWYNNDKTERKKVKGNNEILLRLKEWKDLVQNTQCVN